MQLDSWNGKYLREMFRSGIQFISGSSATVNALNIFPVPDMLTMQSAKVEAYFCIARHLTKSPRSPKGYHSFSIKTEYANPGLGL
ncbi:MAG: hypothetical protein HOC20_13630 [Chloroflexi bacterium]|jgi:hypothetical protein|nr:hypothetical protein [Chloroflexota bacterium]